jgi:hypothetical protein
MHVIILNHRSVHYSTNQKLESCFTQKMTQKEVNVFTGHRHLKVDRESSRISLS